MVTYSEEERIDKLRRFEILDTPQDGSFDRITKLASRIFKVPIAVVSLVDNDRIWFKAKYGLDVPEIGRDPGLCASTILSDEVRVLNDTLDDPIALSNPLVAGKFGLRFYAAAPLITSDGYNLGALAILDFKPRNLTESCKETLHDLSSLVIDQMELRLSARAAVNQQNRLTQIIAHDVKNLVGSIPDLKSLVQSSNYDPVVIDNICDALSTTAKKYNGTVNEAISHSKNSYSPETWEISNIDITSLTREILMVNSGIANNKSITLHLTQDDSFEVLGEETTISVILNNIINNAVKFSPKNTSINIKLRKNGRSGIIRVNDQGPGLTEQDKNNLFKRFSKLSAKPTGNEISSGLGLYISKQLAEKLNGELTAESEGLNKGSTFILKLPLAQ